MEHALAAGAPFGGVGASGMGLPASLGSTNSRTSDRVYRTTKVPITFVPVDLVRAAACQWLAPPRAQESGDGLHPASVVAKLKAAAAVVAAAAVAALPPPISPSVRMISKYRTWLG